MAIVNLEETEWNYVLNLISDRPWRESNNILMKIGSQLRTQRDAQEQKQREREYPEIASRGVPPPSGNSDWLERSQESGKGKAGKGAP